MKKTILIEKLKDETGYSIDKCYLVNEVLESHLIIGKNNKEKTINDFIINLGIDREEAEDLYNKCIKVLGTEIKKKIRHPFKSKK